MTRRKSAKKGTKVGIKNHDEPLKKTGQATGPPPKFIKMNIMLANKYGAFLVGVTYRVPQQVPVPTARNWIRSGAAVEVDG